MYGHRKAAKIDSNQKDVVSALRMIPGVSVEVGHDDILVGYNGKTYWFEIKSKAKSPLKPSQVKLVEKWRGHYQVVHSLEEILNSIMGG